MKVSLGSGFFQAISEHVRLRADRERVIGRFRITNS